MLLASAEHYADNNQLARALIDYQRAVDLYRGMRDRLSAVETLVCVGDLQLKHERMLAAADTYREAIRIGAGHIDESIVGGIRLKLGRCLHENADFANAI